jgi:hypothetical protein
MSSVILKMESDTSLAVLSVLLIIAMIIPYALALLFDCVLDFESSIGACKERMWEAVDISGSHLGSVVKKLLGKGTAVASSEDSCLATPSNVQAASVARLKRRLAREDQPHDRQESRDVEPTALACTSAQVAPTAADQADILLSSDQAGTSSPTAAEDSDPAALVDEEGRGASLLEEDSLYFMPTVTSSSAVDLPPPPEKSQERDKKRSRKAPSSKRGAGDRNRPTTITSSSPSGRRDLPGLAVV